MLIISTRPVAAIIQAVSAGVDLATARPRASAGAAAQRRERNAARPMRSADARSVMMSPP